MFFAFLIAYLLILAIELPPLIRNRWYKEMAVFGVLFLCSVYMGMVQFYHWPFFNPWDHLLPLLPPYHS
ncbi:MAG: hypothetical protein GX133_08815 [Syntrophomonadaceae bacterium]|nr:hypothetical protein [Syntrophomonadaceae bacterium]